MSDWGLHEIDDLVWHGTGESDDHIVPVTEDARVGTCMVKGEQRKKSSREIINALSKSKEQKSVGNKDVLLTEKAVLSCSSTKDEPLPQLLDMGPWHDLQCEKQSATYNVMPGATVMGNKPADDDCYRDVKLESANNDLMIGSYKEDCILENGDSILGDKDEALLNSSCHFSLSDICPPEGDLDFFGNGDEDKESCSLLDYGWANVSNFEDVDGLLRSCESTFRQSGNSSVDELPWSSSSSSACVDNGPQGNVQKRRASSSPESRALKGKLQQNELKMEFMPCDYPSLLATGQEDDSKVQDCQQNDSIKNKPLKQESSEHIQDLQGNSVNDYKGSSVEQHVGHGGNLEGTSIYLKEEAGADKVNYRKQIVGHKQNEKKHKKHLSDKKIIQNMPPVICYSAGFQGQQSLSPKAQTSASPALQILPSPVQTSQKQLIGTGALRQVYPQFPYIHAGYGYPLHHMPIMPSLSTLRPQADRAQPLCFGYQLPADVSNQPQHIRKPFEIPLRPPSMTPQEKIEKLKWRQQMQARLAVEHQQHQFSSQNASPNQTLVHRQQQEIQSQQGGLSPKEGHKLFLQSSSAEAGSFTPLENSSTASGVTYSNNDGSLEANVLRQLQHTITLLDMKTRMRIRDSLYRLARSAMERRCVGDNNTISENGEYIEAGTYINADHGQANRYLGLNDIETETNPIDRTIAHLLFHKNSLPSAGPVSMASDSSNATFSMSPPYFSATPNIWSCQSSAFESPTEVCINSTTNLQFPVPVQLPTTISKTGIGCSPPNMVNIKVSSNGTCNASDVIFDSPLHSTSASMDLWNTEDISVSKHQDVSQNNDSICPSINSNRLTERDPILDNNEGLTELRCQNLPKHQGDSKLLSASTQNMMKQESLESMEIDMLNTDSDMVDVLN